MKRNINLIKDILLKVEEDPNIQCAFDLGSNPILTDYTALEITYHIQLIIESGYLKGKLIIPEDSEEAIIAFVELTWEGHEFLQVLKDKEVLSKVLSLTKEGFTSLSFDLVKSLTKQLIQTKAQKYLGIKAI